MAITYKFQDSVEVLDEDGNSYGPHKRWTFNVVFLIREEGNVLIPFDEDNADYQEYLAWVADGNITEPAD